MTDQLETSDQRLIKGARTRALIAHRAAEVASAEGLTGLSLGRLAADLGMSKSGVATLFGTKENLQLAAVHEAREVFIANVIDPARGEPRGIARLRAIVDHWFAYTAEPVLPGGCFRVATTAEYDSRSGPVHDAIKKDGDDWLGYLEKQIRDAQAEGLLGSVDAHALAFQLDALVSAATTGMQMGDPTALSTARGLIDQLIG